MTLKLGMYLVYPGHGIGLVTRIETKDILGKNTEFARLTLLNSGMNVLFPVSSIDTIGIRELSDKNTVEQALQIIEEKSTIIDNITWNKRYRQYMEKLKSGNLIDIAETFRDLKNLDKELSFGERKMLDTAKTLLFKEVEIVLKGDENVRTKT